MADYDYKCRCGRVTEVEARMGEAPSVVDCFCGQQAKRIYHMPNVSLNKWDPNLRFNDVSDELDGERDATAMGMNE